MFLYKNRLKTLLRNKTLIFWTMLFPFLLSTLFYFAFGKLNNLHEYNSINIAIVDAENVPEELLNALKTTKFSEHTNMFTVEEVNLNQAINLLDEQKIKGYIYYDNAVVLVINHSGINETIIKVFLDEFVQTSSIITSLMIKTNGALDINDLIRDISNRQEYLQYSSNNNTPDVTLIYFYALVAMAIINGSFWGALEINNLQPNLSPTGIRLSISPTKRFKLLLSNILAAFTIHITIVFLFILYLRYILGISFGLNFSLLFLVAILGTLTAISFGSLLSISLKRAQEGLKIGICTSIGVFGGLLSGMMLPNIKYWIDAYVPILSIINPVNIITDSIFSLYYFTTFTRFYRNILILTIMLLLFISFTIIQFRRESYDSI